MIGFKVFSAVAVSGTTVYPSRPTEIPRQSELSYIVDTTGTLTGTLIVEVGNQTDEELAANADAGWTTYDKVTLPAISGVMRFGISLRPTFGRARLKYTNATNSGTITAAATVKAR